MKRIKEIRNPRTSLYGLSEYLKIAGRILLRNKLISGINLISLSTGICTVLLITAFISNEYNFDTFHEKGSRIFRAGFDYMSQGKLDGQGVSEFSASFGPDAKAELPGIEEFCRLTNSDESYINYKNQSLKVKGMVYADSTFFKLFSFKLLRGTPSSVLREPGNIVLTETTATKIFGNIDKAVGKIVKLDDKKTAIVTGVVEDIPANTDIRYESLISFSTLNTDSTIFLGWRGGYRYTTWLLLDKAANKEDLEKALPAFMWRHLNKQDAAFGDKTEARLQPLSEIHLNHNSDSAVLKRNIRIFCTIALLILVISCVNYINFSMAQSVTRFKEIGIRRVLGAENMQLRIRWFTEALLTTGIAFVIAAALIFSLSPLFRQFTGNHFSMPAIFNNSVLLLASAILFVLLAAGTGFYLSIYHSGANILSNPVFPLSGIGNRFRGRWLIMLQFIVSITLISCTFVMYMQIRFVKTRPTGFDREKVLIVPLTGHKTNEVSAIIKHSISNLSNVSSVSAISEVPVEGITRNGFTPEGQTQALMIHQLDADEDFLKTFQIRLLSGHYFRQGSNMDNDGYIINETLAKMLCWKDPVGKTINRNGSHKIIGVVKDFHFTSLRERIGPMIITNQPWQGYDYLAVRYTSKPSLLISEIDSIWKNNSPLPFEYWFLDSEFDWMYRDEQRFMTLLAAFSAISIALSLSGVFGLVSLGIQQRLKEISIRKVLGASVTEIVKLISSSLLLLVLIASLIAFPAGSYLMSVWLQDFAYRISVSWWMIASGGFVVLLVTFLTVSTRVIKAAFINPAEILRNE